MIKNIPLLRGIIKFYIMSWGIPLNLFCKIKMAIKEQNEQCIEIIARILGKIKQAIETIEGTVESKEGQSGKQ